MEVSNIEVVYNHVILVLKGVSLSLSKGSIVALLGGNGAGKTTTINMLTGLLPPSSSLSGNTSIYGSDIASGMTTIRQMMGALR